MMQTIRLTEHEDSEPVPITLEDWDDISGYLNEATITPAPAGQPGYIINPKNHVGLIRTGDITIQIAPKLDISRVLFLVFYGLDPDYWKEHTVELEDAPTLHEAIARPFADFAEQATRRGPLHGYLTIDDSLPGVRGRIRFADQLRRHQRVTTPIEVTYDEFTPDIDENRLLLAASQRLLRLQALSEPTTKKLRRVIGRLTDVTSVRYDRRNVPEPQLNRLNRHYAQPLTLARLILGDETIELSDETPTVTSRGLLFNMAKVFETFVHAALRKALNLSTHEFPKNVRRRRLNLDNAGKVKLEPDLSWWDQERCVMVGDVKYKRTVDTGRKAKDSDLYQLLAYTTATQVDTGFLIYAAGESEPVTHTVRFADTDLVVETLTLDNEPEAILDEIGALAERISNARYQQTPALSAA